jgi:hypothetical protein
MRALFGVTTTIALISAVSAPALAQQSLHYCRQPSLWAYLRCSYQRLMIAKILQCSKLNLLGQSRKALDGGRNKDT